MSQRLALALACIIFSSHLLVAQPDSYADSLIIHVKSLSSEALQMDALDSLCTLYSRSYRPGGAPLFVMRNELIRPQENFEAGLERHKKTGFYFIRTADWDLAQREVDFYYSRISEVKEPVLLADVYYTKSFLEEQLGRNEVALVAIEDCIAVHEQMRDTSLIQFGESYKAQGRLLSNMARYGEASLAYSKAKEVFTASSDSIGMSDVLYQLGILYAQIGLYDDSESYFQERYRYVSNAPDIMRISDLINVGRNIILQRRYQDAKAKYQEALDMRPYDDGYEGMEIYAFNGLIEASYFNADSDEVIPLFEEMEMLYKELGGREDLDFLMKQSRFFALLVDEAYGEAEIIGEGLYASSLEKHDASEAMLHAEFLTELYKRNGNYAKALKYSELYSTARDSILTANKTNALLLYQTQFETKEKELEIDKLAIEKKVEASKGRTYLWIAGLLGALLLIGGGLYLQLRKTRATLEVQNLELQSLNAIKNKFFGIIGHDLGGPLVVFDALGKRIRRQVASKDMDKIAESANLLSESSSKLTSLLDNLLKWALSENGVMPYHPENIDLVEITKENVALFKEQAKEKEITVIVNLDTSSMIHADKNAVSTISRNIISNAIKFTPQGGLIDLGLQESNGMIELVCADDGVGMDAGKIAELFTRNNKTMRGTAGETGTGLGMILIKELTELNKGKISVESKVGKGTCIRVLLPKA